MDGARAGAPQAMQVAARVPPPQNLAAALDQGFSVHGPALQAVRTALSRTPVVPVPPSPPPPPAPTQAAPRRSRRFATSEQLWSRHRQGWSDRASAQPRGIGRMTVVRSRQAPTSPARKGRSATGRSLLTPYQERLLQRWKAGGREA